jgi:hypothetical protein
MRIILLLLVFCFIPTLAFARGGEMSGGMERYRIGGFYGYGSLPAGDVNNFINQQSTSPHLGNLSNALSYGGYLGLMLTPHWEVVAEYEQQWASNPVNETSPSVVNNAGINLYMNSAWAGLYYWFLDHGSLHLAIGGLAGYPTYAHATVISGPYTQYDAAAVPIYQAVGTASIMLSKMFSIDIEGGYQYALIGPLANGSTAASNLKQSNGSNVNLDFSGWRGKAGASLHF